MHWFRAKNVTAGSELVDLITCLQEAVSVIEQIFQKLAKESDDFSHEKEEFARINCGAEKIIEKFGLLGQKLGGILEALKATECPKPLPKAFVYARLIYERDVFAALQEALRLLKIRARRYARSNYVSIRQLADWKRGTEGLDSASISFAQKRRKTEEEDLLIADWLDDFFFTMKWQFFKPTEDVLELMEAGIKRA